METRFKTTLYNGTKYRLFSATVGGSGGAEPTGIDLSDYTEIIVRAPLGDELTFCVWQRLEGTEVLLGEEVQLRVRVLRLDADVGRRHGRTGERAAVEGGLRAAQSQSVAAVAEVGEVVAVPKQVRVRGRCMATGSRGRRVRQDGLLHLESDDTRTNHGNSPEWSTEWRSSDTYSPCDCARKNKTMMVAK